MHRYLQIIEANLYEKCKVKFLALAFLLKAVNYPANTGGLSEVESRTQGSRPRTQKKKRDQGQGQRFRGQTLSRPRTGILKAKAKDQGHSHKCSPKKTVFKKSFSGDLQFIGVPRIFNWAKPKPQITCNDAIKNFQKRKFLRDKEIVGRKI